MMSVKRLLFLLAFFSLGLNLILSAGIRDYDFVSYLKQTKFPDCPMESPIRIDSIMFFDFGKEGSEKAVIERWSCMSGTGGRDIHSVYMLEGSSGVKEIKINYSSQTAKVSGIPLPLIGNRNYTFVIKDGLLCEDFYDGSGRKNPIENCFEYREGEFNLVSQNYGPTYPTSFDCRKAKSDREISVCGNEDLAKMDLELNRLYRKLSDSLSLPERKKLIKQQREWLRQTDLIEVYKASDPFREAYASRTEELKAQIK